MIRWRKAKRLPPRLCGVGLKYPRARDGTSHSPNQAESAGPPDTQSEKPPSSLAICALSAFADHWERSPGFHSLGYTRERQRSQMTDKPSSITWRCHLLNTAMVRKIDDLGRIVIPAETRRLFNIREGDELAISVDGDSIIIRKLDATCVFCGSTDDVSEFKGRGVCASCRSTLAG